MINYSVIRSDDYLSHHGILGQKWGVRRYQNADGSLTAAGRAHYGVKAQKMLEKAQKQAYKQRRKEGGSYLFKTARTSTGKNYDKAYDEFDSVISNDKKYEQLSRKAFDSTKKLLMAEKKFIQKHSYDEWIQSEEYDRLSRQAEKDTDAKNDYVLDAAKKFADTSLKDAKIKDLKINPSEEKYIREFISSQNDFLWYWDGNLEYNYDLFYEPGHENEKFEKPKPRH